MNSSYRTYITIGSLLLAFACARQTNKTQALEHYRLGQPVDPKSPLDEMMPEIIYDPRSESISIKPPIAHVLIGQRVQLTSENPECSELGMRLESIADDGTVTVLDIPTQRLYNASPGQAFRTDGFATPELAPRLESSDFITQTAVIDCVWCETRVEEVDDPIQSRIE